jgi:hypothetical protein
MESNSIRVPARTRFLLVCTCRIDRWPVLIWGLWWWESSIWGPVYLSLNYWYSPYDRVSDGGHHRFAFSRRSCFQYLIRRRGNVLIWSGELETILLRTRSFLLHHRYDAIRNIFTMNYDVPDLKQKLQSLRTLPAEDILELATYFWVLSTWRWVGIR